MPFSYRIWKEQRLVISTGSGSVTYAEVKACIDKAVVDPEFSPTFDELIDLRAVTSIAMSVEQAKLLAASPHFSSSAKRALVASVPHVFGMGRLFAAYNEVWKGQPVNAHYDLAQALKSLGREGDPELTTALKDGTIRLS